MSRRFNSRIGASVLIGLASVYLIASLALGRSATAEPPPDLSLKAADAGVDAFRVAGALLDGATIVDVRSPAEFSRYHIPGAINAPDATPAVLFPYVRSGAVIVVAASDEAAQKLTGQARAADPSGSYFFLRAGVRGWYMTFELPVALFNDQDPPSGYAEALQTVKRYVATRDPALRDPARMALFRLVRMNYQPTLLGSTATAKPAAGARKKISGGCGG
jgi:rhodanese-related sulfurtransferase